MPIPSVDVILLDSQKNDVHEAIQAAGLNPSDFNWEVNDYPTQRGTVPVRQSRIVYLPHPDFHMTFGPTENEWSPGAASRHQRDRHRSDWLVQKANVLLWLQSLRRELGVTVSHGAALPSSPGGRTQPQSLSSPTRAAKQSPQATRTPIQFETATNTYSSDRILGEGGCGRVYRVTDSDGAEYAIKLLTSARSDQRKRFKNELNFCRKNAHDRIIKVLDDGVYKNGSESQPFYVMPLYKATLRMRMNEGLNADQIPPLLSDILDGVEAAHLKGVIHRDLKPENIMISDGGRAVVADFGIAHFEEDNLITTVETKPSHRLANFSYSAPEQRRRGGQVDARADLFALGLILNEMFTGEIPQGSDYKRIAHAVPAYAYLDEIVDKMIKQNPAERPATIESVKNDLLIRGAWAVTLQKLDQITRTVVPASQPDDPLGGQDVRATGFDYTPGSLIFRLEPAPPPQWVDALHNISRYQSIVGGAAPSAVADNHDGTFSVPASESSAVMVRNIVPQWIAQANPEYRAHLQAQADQRERERRQQVESRRRLLEEQARVQEALRTLERS